jgi:hypothetical protein
LAEPAGSANKLGTFLKRTPANFDNAKWASETKGGRRLRLTHSRLDPGRFAAAT